MTVSDAELAVHQSSLAPAIDAYNALDQMADELPPVHSHSGAWIDGVCRSV